MSRSDDMHKDDNHANIEIRIRKMIILKENDWEKIMMMTKPVDCPKNKKENMMMVVMMMMMMMMMVVVTCLIQLIIRLFFRDRSTVVSTPCWKTSCYCC